jgi:hypothetical protein
MLREGGREGEREGEGLCHQWKIELTEVRAKEEGSGAKEGRESRRE